MMNIKLVFFLLLFLECSTNSFSQHSESILPTPDSTFFNNPNPQAENLIEKYVKSYFAVTQPTEVLETTSTDHPEGVWDCHTKTEYGKIITTTYTCDMQFDQIFRFDNYTFEEVHRILKLLFVDNNEGYWNGSKYGNGIGCSIEIEKNNGKIIVALGCGC